jgi:hypothetical protein
MGVGPVGFSVEQQNLLWVMWRCGDSIRELPPVSRRLCYLSGSGPFGLEGSRSVLMPPGVPSGLVLVGRAPVEALLDPPGVVLMWVILSSVGL